MTKDTTVTIAASVKNRAGASATTLRDDAAGYGLVAGRCPLCETYLVSQLWTTTARWSICTATARAVQAVPLIFIQRAGCRHCQPLLPLGQGERGLRFQVHDVAISIISERHRGPARGVCPMCGREASVELCTPRAQLAQHATCMGYPTVVCRATSMDCLTGLVRCLECNGSGSSMGAFIARVSTRGSDS